MPSEGEVCSLLRSVPKLILRNFFVVFCVSILLTLFVAYGGFWSHLRGNGASWIAFQTSESQYECWFFRSNWAHDSVEFSPSPGGGFSGRPSFLGEEPLLYVIERRCSSPRERPVWSHGAQSVVVDAYNDPSYGPFLHNVPSVYAGAVAIGWPFRCISFEWSCESSASNAKIYDCIIIPLHFKVQYLGYRGIPIPYNILWVGFLLNVAIWCAGVSSIIIIARVGRERYRFRRGYCIGCAFDMTCDYSRVCPECGWRLKDR